MRKRCMFKVFLSSLYYNWSRIICIVVFLILYFVYNLLIQILTYTFKTHFDTILPFFPMYHISFSYRLVNKKLFYLFICTFLSSLKCYCNSTYIKTFVLLLYLDIWQFFFKIRFVYLMH